MEQGAGGQGTKVVEEQEDPGEVETPKGKKSICKTILRFLASQGGLFIVLVIYIVMGAELFIVLEGPLEEEARLVGISSCSC